MRALSLQELEWVSGGDETAATVTDDSGGGGGIPTITISGLSAEAATSYANMVVGQATQQAASIVVNKVAQVVKQQVVPTILNTAVNMSKSVALIGETTASSLLVAVAIVKKPRPAY